MLREIIPHVKVSHGFDAAAERLALQLPPRRAPLDSFKKGTISRAEGGQLQAPVGWHDSAHDSVPHANEHAAMTF